MNAETVLAPSMQSSGAYDEDPISRRVQPEDIPLDSDSFGEQ